MSLNPQQSSLHLALPSSSAQARVPTNITVHPSVVASILTHHSRRTDTEQPRVLGALLGHRSENGSEVEVRSCFAVPHTESEETVALDMPFQKNMVAMMAKTGVKEQVVGWYATSATINPYSALLHHYFGQETAPFPAVHLTVDTDLTAQGSGLGVKGYSSLPLSAAANPKSENCIFLPVPVAIKFAPSERAGLDLLTSAQPQSPSLPTLPTFASSLDSLLALLDQASEYVAAVQSGKVQGDEQVGRYLLEAVGRWSAAAGSEEEEEGEGGVKKGVQDTLSVSYLASLLRMQVELQGRLGLVQQQGQAA